MARKVMILKVFVASPDDVQNERARLEDLIHRQNKFWGSSFGIQLDLVRWESDALPGVGKDAQAVIDEQIGNDYDIFVGIMWTKLGTRTTRAASGTVEEFNRAYESWQDDCRALRIMFYFCEADIPQRNLDPDQYARLKAFRESLKEKGVLYSTYSGAEEFEKLVSFHLNEQVVDFGKGWGKSTPSEMVQVKRQEEMGAPSHEVASVEEETEDEGLLDVVDRGSEDFETMTKSLHTMSATVETLGSDLQKRTDDMMKASSEKPELFVKLGRQIANQTATHLNRFVSEIDNELPIFSKSLSGAVNAVAKVASLAGTGGFASQERPIADLLEMMTGLATSIKGALRATIDFRTGLKAWPRLTTKLNRAKTRALTTVDELISELHKGVRLISGVEEEIRRILGQEE